MYNRQNIADYLVFTGGTYMTVSPNRAQTSGLLYIKPFGFYPLLKGLFGNPIMLGKVKGSYYV